MTDTATELSPRYALYFAPQGGDLYELGRRWLARDVRLGEDLPPPEWPGLDHREYHEVVAAPHRYGFHGTFKPPFHLIEHATETELLLAVDRFAVPRPAFEVPPLELRVMNDFIALMPDGPYPELDALARACVEEFDRFRAPMTEAERARRLDTNLTPRQEELVAEYGYPYVLDQFKFHLTLTGSLGEADRAKWLELLGEFWAPVLGRPVAVDGVAVFRAPGLNMSFSQIGFFPFGA